MGSEPKVSDRPRRDRVTRVGATLARDFKGLVVKSELIHTTGWKFSSAILDGGDSLVRLYTLDWVIGLDFTPAGDWELNAWLFQRIFLNYDPAIRG